MHKVYWICGEIVGFGEIIVSIVCSFCYHYGQITDIVQAYQLVSGFSVYPQEFLIILSYYDLSKHPEFQIFAWVLFIKQSMKYALKLLPLVYQVQGVAKQ